MKNGNFLAATCTVKATFSYNSSTATISSSTHSKSIKTGYSEDAYSTLNRDMSFLYGDAIANTYLSVRNNSTGKAYLGIAMVSCGKNG